MRQIKMSAIVVVCCLLLSACAEQNNLEQSEESTNNTSELGGESGDIGFETPEDVIDYYAQQIAEGDLKEAVSAFAVNLMAENYDLTAQVMWAGMWSTSYTMPYPSEDAVYLEANKVFLEAQMMEQIANMCVSLNLDEEYLEQAMVQVENENAVAELFHLENLDTFKVSEIEYAEEELQDSETHQNNLQRRNEIYGSEGFREYIITYEYNGAFYMGGATFVRYGELWYLASLQSNLAGTSSNCYLVKIR